MTEQFGDTHFRTSHECCSECGRPFAERDSECGRIEGPLLIYGKHRIRLTEQERRIMRVLMRASGETVHRDRILGAVWGDRDIEPKIVDVRMCGIRKKLRGSGLSIECQFGIGYRLIADSNFVENVERRA
jgi:DNA-binding winged helix-turn-helix (wHTH) protein